jgi:hypothetical protein
MAMEYTLSPGVHASRIGDSWIFLDITRDKYYCLAGEPARQYSELITSSATDCLSARACAVAQKLTTSGLLVESTPALRRGGGLVTTRLQSALNDDFGPQNEHVAPQDVMRFVREFAACAHLQDPRKRQLARIIEDVRTLKSRVQEIARNESRSSASLTRAFRRIAPCFFSAHDACFFSSLLLVRFLARSGIAADWTFGVRLSPFRAHCWVSHQGLILNEDSLVVAGFEPILVV